jgi:hypothetical protein
VAILITFATLSHGTPHPSRRKDHHFLPLKELIMKRTLLFSLAAASLLLTTGCQKDAKESASATEQATDKKQEPAGPCNPNAYVITLESKTLVNGNWEWVWSVQNPNPGNGNNGTVQDLSHWGMQFGSCFNWDHVVSAAVSSNGSNWNSFSPDYKSDPSQNCLTTPVLKFDTGTSGSAKTYYKLVVSVNYPAGAMSGYYKSGSRTGCCTFTFTGIACAVQPT